MRPFRIVGRVIDQPAIGRLTARPFKSVEWRISVGLFADIIAQCVEEKREERSRVQWPSVEFGFVL